MFWVLNDEGDSRANSALYHVPSSDSHGDGAHRHRGTIPEVTGRLTTCRHVRDSTSRSQLPYGARDKSVSALLGVVKHFVADTRVPRAFMTDNGAEYTNSTFVDYCNGLEIRRELTGPYTPRSTTA